jgi:hypothetical protein
MPDRGWYGTPTSKGQCTGNDFTSCTIVAHRLSLLTSLPNDIPLDSVN